MTAIFSTTRFGLGLVVICWSRST